MNTKELIDRIFKEPGIQFELTEFENLGKPIHDIITIYPKVVTSGKDAGKTKYWSNSRSRDNCSNLPNPASNNSSKPPSNHEP